ncbi:hypothetical protein H311_02652 [Anncaliia algerae PRA109]|nr:hypothetical protein H311_02652 [Anncaliia algerae PRA109]
MLIILLKLCQCRKIDQYFLIRAIDILQAIINIYKDNSEYSNRKMEVMFNDVNDLLNDHIYPLNYKFNKFSCMRKQFNYSGSIILSDEEDFKDLKDRILNNIESCIQENKGKYFDRTFVNITSFYHNDSLEVFEQYFLGGYPSLGMSLIFLEMFLKATSKNLCLNNNNDFCLILNEDLAEFYNPYSKGYICLQN